MNDQLTPQQKAALTRAKNKAQIPTEETKENKEIPIDSETTKNKSFSIIRKKDGWYFIEYEMIDDKVIKKHEVGPTMRAIIIEEFKVTAQRYMESLE